MVNIELAFELMVTGFISVYSIPLRKQRELTKDPLKNSLENLLDASKICYKGVSIPEIKFV